jgi:polyhydroxybutyrate depolymerase
MAGLLACRLAARVAAVAPVSGAFFSSFESGCAPQRPVPLLEFHGSADHVVPYFGGGSENFLPVPRWLNGWAARDGCNGPGSIFYERNGATGEQWTGCSGSAIVEHYLLDGAGHAWPGGDGGPQQLNAGAVAWDFFEAHPLV